MGYDYLSYKQQERTELLIKELYAEIEKLHERAKSYNSDWSNLRNENTELLRRVEETEVLWVENRLEDLLVVKKERDELQLQLGGQTLELNLANETIADLRMTLNMMRTQKQVLADQFTVAQTKLDEALALPNECDYISKIKDLETKLATLEPRVVKSTWQNQYANIDHRGQYSTSRATADSTQELLWGRIGVLRRVTYSDGTVIATLEPV